MLSEGIKPLFGKGKEDFIQRIYGAPIYGAPY
jgi:hypothetical protein